MCRFFINCIAAFCVFIFLTYIFVKLFAWFNPQQHDSDGRDEDNALRGLLLSFVLSGAFTGYLELKRVAQKEDNK